jgi:hypothetical protein
LSSSFSTRITDIAQIPDWYDVNATNFIEYLQDFHDTFQRPIWVTEWACQNFNDEDEQCSYDDIRTFLNTTQSFMDATDWVERYSWFGAFRELQGVNPVRITWSKRTPLEVWLTWALLRPTDL